MYTAEYAKKNFYEDCIYVDMHYNYSSVNEIPYNFQMVEEWVKNKTPIAINQGPTLREKSILLVKLMQYVEKRFSEDTELMAQFLELVIHVYRDETLRNTELTAKLEPAFLSGLRCTQPHIRAKFFQVP